MRATVVGLLVAAAFVLSGCQYLLSGMMGGPIVMPDGSFDPGEFGSFDPGDFGSFDPNDPIFSIPPPLATFTTGSATLSIAGVKTELGDLSGTGAVYADGGSEAGWTNGAGTYIRVYSEPESLSGQGFVTIDRIVNSQHWTIADPAACKVTLTTNDATGLAGNATCNGMRWVDALSPGGPQQPGIEGEAPFDAEITFQAAP